MISYNSVHDRNLMKNPDGSYIYNTADFNSFERFQKGKLPAWVDLYVGMLEEADAIKAKTLFDAGLFNDVKPFVDRNTRRYCTRVYFSNRQGYAGDR